MSNFAMFERGWEDLFLISYQAEDNLYKDAETTATKMRILAEKITRLVGAYENIKLNDYKNQIDHLRLLEKNGILEGDILNAFHTVRKLGNRAAHGEELSFNDAKLSLTMGHIISSWFYKVYLDYDYEIIDFKLPKREEEISFDEIEDMKAKMADLESQKDYYEDKYNKKLEELNKSLSHLEKKEIRKKKSREFLKKEISELDTRISFIDPRLREAGWEADSENLTWGKGIRPEKNRNIAISEFPLDGGRVDYALFIGLDLYGFVEAKKFNEEISSHLFQAKIYSENMKAFEGINLITERKYKVPFLYSTNGREYIKQHKEKSGIWYINVNSNEIAKPLEAFHSPENLKDIFSMDIEKANAELANKEYPGFADRYYQKEAIESVEKAILHGQDRMLLALATGTGKTRIAIALMYRLLESKRFKRILFLVDRNSLGIQAQNALDDIKVEGLSISDIYNVNELEDKYPEASTRIQVATVQGMVNRLFYSEEDKLNVGDFDFIIVDEAHRGYTEDSEMTEEEALYLDQDHYISQYRRVIDYFDAKVLALTATPASHTVNIFGKPIYTYTYSQAVVDGYLVDYDPPHRIITELSEEGISFAKDSQVSIWDDENKKLDKVFLEDELNFEVEDFNKKVLNENFNRVVCDYLTEEIFLDEPGKTLIFAANNNHADILVRLLKEAYTDKGDIFSDDAIMKITGAIKNQDEAIKKFKNEVNPKIVVTVDLLTTGIDVPEIVNLVFIRRVKSRILYDQMLGRATRLCPEIKKSSFRVFDAVKMYDAMKDITDMKPVLKRVNIKIETLLYELYKEEDQDKKEYLKKEILAKIQRKKQVLDLDDIKTINVLKDADNHLSKTSEVLYLEENSDISKLEAWIEDISNKTAEEIYKVRDEIIKFLNYRPGIRQAFISYDEDKLIDVKRGFGPNISRPDDYLQSFSNFINKNINEYFGLNIIANRPKDLTLDELRNIRLILREKDFTEEALRSAWKQVKNEDVAADIISFIRQAAIGSPLISHEARIKRAMQKVYGMHSWTKRQKKWLERIEKKLLEDNVLAPSAKEYFNQGIWARDAGGYNRISKMLDYKADDIIDLLNEELYREG